MLSSSDCFGWLSLTHTLYESIGFLGICFRGSSFWDISKTTTNGSWMWKKLFKLREVVALFLTKEIGDGSSTFYGQTYDVGLMLWFTLSDKLEPDCSVFVGTLMLRKPRMLMAGNFVDAKIHHFEIWLIALKCYILPMLLWETTFHHGSRTRTNMLIRFPQVVLGISFDLPG